MTIVGQPLDRVDGRLKVTGRATYAAEFDAANMAHARAGAEHHRRGRDHRHRYCGAREAMPGVLAIITPRQRAEAADAEQGAQQTGRVLPLLQDDDVLLQRPAHRARRRRHARAGAMPRPRWCACDYDAAEAASRRWMRRSSQAYRAEAFPQRRAAARQHARRSRRRVRGRRRCRLDATYTTPIEHHNPMEPHATIAALGGRPAHASGPPPRASPARSTTLAACSASPRRTSA